jgi:hypothetical protein
VRTTRVAGAARRRPPAPADPCCRSRTRAAPETSVDRTIDIDRKIDVVAHRHGDVFLRNHSFMSGWAIIMHRKAVTRFR